MAQNQGCSSLRSTPRRARRDRYAWLAAAVSLLLVATACGQKPGVATATGTSAGAAQALGNPAAGGALPAGSGAGSTSVRSGSGISLASGPGPAGAPGAGVAPNTGSAPGTSRSIPTTRLPGAPRGGDSTGVSSTVIKVGIHVPMTGAAPVPSASFDKGKDLYFKWLAQQGMTIAGRRVKIIAKNDNFDASQAVSVCKEMVEKDHVFMLVGFSGSDEVTACARYAESVGVPYLSGGTTETGLNSLPNYFAIWDTYEQAAPLLAGLIAKDLNGKSSVNAMVRYDDPNLDAPHRAFLNSMRSFGAKVGFDKTVPSEANSTDAQTLATELKQAGVKNVYMLTSPIFWLQVAHAAATQNYHPTWIGVQEAEDELLQAGCQNNAVAGAEMFHMVPGFVDANRFDPDFAKAGGADDIEWILWGLDKEIAATLALPGKNLTRERFVYYLERAHKIQTGVAPALSFSPSHHFGGTALHLLRADCSTEHWVTQRAFVSHF